MDVRIVEVLYMTNESGVYSVDRLGEGTGEGVVCLGLAPVGGGFLDVDRVDVGWLMFRPKFCCAFNPKRVGQSGTNVPLWDKLFLGICSASCRYGRARLFVVFVDRVSSRDRAENVSCKCCCWS